MSMVINLVEDHNIYLCEGGPVYNGSVHPTPITYLTQWKIVGNSEVHGNEIWSCGEYNPIDGKYHILVQPLGGSIADIALTEPLRKVNNVADTIEFPSDTEGKALVTRPFGSGDMGTFKFKSVDTGVENIYRIATAALKNVIAKVSNSNVKGNIICAIYDTVTANNTYNTNKVGIAVNDSGILSIYDDNYNQSTDTEAFLEHINGVELIYELATPTTELVDAPQIAEAESYTCVISQGAKAVSWSDFIYDSYYLLTDSENNILVDSENYQLTVQS